MKTSKLHTMDNAVKLVGEAFVPGASLLLDGKIAEGSAHLLLGTWAKLALGPIGLALVIANSYTKSTTGKNLLEEVSEDESVLEARAELTSAVT